MTLLESRMLGLSRRTQMVRKINILIVLCFGLATFCGGRSAAANLVANPGFETGDFTGWTVTGNGIGIDTVFPNTGNFDAFFGALTTDSNPGVLSQILATRAGQSYTLSFTILDEAGFSGDTFTVTLGGFTAVITGDQAAPPGDLPSGYTAEVFAVPSADIAGGDTLAFQGLNDPTIGIDWNLDDVSITAVSEPPAVALLGTALIACFALASPRGSRRLRLRHPV
jgi:hypothetical protein